MQMSFVMTGVDAAELEHVINSSFDGVMGESASAAKARGICNRAIKNHLEHVMHFDYNAFCLTKATIIDLPKHPYAVRIDYKFEPIEE